MTDASAGKDPRRQRLAMILLVTGAVLVAISFVWPTLPLGKSTWTKELAQQHQEASANLHGLTHKYAHELETAPPGILPEELREARGEFAVLNRQLDAARVRPMRIATALCVVGIGLSILGAAAYFAAARH